MYGHKCRKILNGLHLHKDHINSDIANIKKRGKYTSKQKSQKIKNIMKKKAWLYQRMEDLTTTMHYETIKSLRKYPVILLPEFAIQGMTKNLPRNQKREMQSLRHYTFKKILSHKCKIYNQKLFIINEAYSTIECFKCNHQSKESVYSR
eukprot:NODE_42_length_29671_cov_0.584810.p16 type:complete len:149 gc:universal NODE_42_length_29671_cov_0.584810:23890-24336(+)